MRSRLSKNAPLDCFVSWAILAAMAGLSVLKTLESVVGLSVKITNTFDTEYTGTIYAYSTDSGLLVLQVPVQTPVGERNNYKFLKTAYIKNLEILQKKINETKVAKISRVDTSQIPRIREKNTKTSGILKSTRNVQATAEGQQVFNALYKTVPNVRWKSNSIIVLDEVVIDNPYTVNSIKSLKSDADESDAISLVKKIVDGVWTNGRKGG